MYRSRALIFLLAMTFVVGFGVDAHAVIYNWTSRDYGDSFRSNAFWKDSLNQSPASKEVLWNLMSDASQGAEFWVTDPNNEIGMRGFDTSDGQIDSTHMSITVNAPFHYVSDPNEGTRRMFFKDQWKSFNTYTFNELYFQGTMGLWDLGSTVHLAGNMQVTGPAEFVTSSQDATIYIDALIDASRIDVFDIRWNKDKTAYSSESDLHLTNGNNAFFGMWRLTARLYADADGALGDADVLVCGAGVLGTDPNVTADDGKNQGILVLGSAGAISPTAKLELTPATYGSLAGKVVVNADVTVRQLVVDGNSVIPAGTYTAATFPVSGYMEGTGSITVADVNASAVMTMACADTLSNPITGDTGLMPRVGTKGYKPGYVARIRAPHTMSIGGAGYTFAHWTGTGIANASAEDTTVTMDVSKTVTAVYTKANGASAPTPANKAGYISVVTGLSWTPDPGATSQSVYFGDSTAVYGPDATPIYTGNGSLSSLTNAQIGSTLRDNTNYYWQVRSNVGNDAKPQWMFTTGSSRATTPTPADGATEQAVNATLQWVSPDAGATSFDVYFGTSKSAVENGTVTPVNVTATQLAESGLSRGGWYYWRVDTKFAGKTTVGDVWGFRVDAVKIYLDTTDLTAKDEVDNDIAGVTIFVDDGGVAVFKFTTFNYGLEYDVIVSGDRKLAIWSDSSISFGGTLDATPPTNLARAEGIAKLGGYKGGAPALWWNKNNSTDPNFAVYRWNPVTAPTTDRWQYFWMTGDMNYYRRLHGDDPAFRYPIGDDTVYGPGRPYQQFNYESDPYANPPRMKMCKETVYGSGGTYGGFGGNSIGTIANGVTIRQPGSHAGAYAAWSPDLPGVYGQKELYELWGGSGGSGSTRLLASTITTPSCRTRGGGAGGGVVEIYSAGNITIGPLARIKVDGGSTFCENVRYANELPDTLPGTSGSQYPIQGGAGSGGSLRLVAKGNMAIAGALSANGGQGADATPLQGSTRAVGGGGGGGRIAIYKGGTLSSAGSTVTVAGGRSGTTPGTMTDAAKAWIAGKSGTVYGLEAGEGAASMVTKAHWPIPADGSRGIDAGTAELTWLPGLGSTTNTVYFGTTTSPGLLTSVAGGRARKSVSVPIVLNTKYYWRVDCDGVPGPLWMFRSTGWEAKNPTPANGATNVVTTGLQLMWQDGFDPNLITKREVFFGTDQVAVANATTSSPLKIATLDDGPAVPLVVNLSPLLASTTYYWRVDTFWSVSPTYVDGLVWNFTTHPPICQGVMAGDFNNDCKVNFIDFALLAVDWKKCGLADPLMCP